MQVWTLSRKLVAEQIQVASVTEHPVAPMALRAQVVYVLMSVGGCWLRKKMVERGHTAHGGKVGACAADKWSSDKRPKAVAVKARMAVGGWSIVRYRNEGLCSV